MATPQTQASQRQDMTSEDQFGRPWCFAIEKRTGAPTGRIDAAGWADPLKTPQRFMRVPKTKYGQPAFGQIRVDEKMWIKRQKAHLNEWQTQFLQNAATAHKGGFDATTVWDDPWVQRLTGPAPFPSVECLEAAFDRDHPASDALLGLAPLTEEAMVLLGIDVRLTKHKEELVAAVQTVDEDEGSRGEPSPAVTFDDLPVNLKYQQFVAIMTKGTKRTMKDISPLWKQYKEEKGP